MNRFIQWSKEEFFRIFPAVIYFWIAFSVIYIATGLDLRPGETRMLNYFMVCFSAMLIGKIIIIVNALPFVNAFPNRPLIYNILWKFFLYCIAVQIVSYLHIWIHASFHFDSAIAGWDRLKYAFDIRGFWANEIWICMTFLYYVIFSEFTIALGRQRVRQMLFG